MGRDPSADAGHPVGAHLDTYQDFVQIRGGESLGEAFDRVRHRLLAYDIFPPTFLRYAFCGEGAVVEGQTIVQRFGVGVAIEAAVRVTKVWETLELGNRVCGFAYSTLPGHPERGVATFEVRLAGDTVAVVLTARSVARTPVVTRPVAKAIQRAITRRAVRRLVQG